MRAAVVTENFGVEPETEAVGVSLPLAALAEPGTYICDWSGHLLRVPEADRGTRCFVTVRPASLRQWTVTRISADPHISRFEARALANGMGLSVNF